MFWTDALVDEEASVVQWVRRLRVVPTTIPFQRSGFTSRWKKIKSDFSKGLLVRKMSVTSGFSLTVYLSFYLSIYLSLYLSFCLFLSISLSIVVYRQEVMPEQL